MNIETKIEKYRLAKQNLAEVKALEMELRIDLAETISAEGFAKGTHTFDYTGMQVKVVSKLNYKIDKAILETLDLTEEEAECIRWKPEVEMKVYNVAEETDNLDEAIIITPSVPTITVELVE